MPRGVAPEKSFPGLSQYTGPWWILPLGGGADGEGGLPSSPVSPRSDTHNPPPRPRFALLPRPPQGGGVSVWRYSGKSVPGCGSGPGSSPAYPDAVDRGGYRPGGGADGEGGLPSSPVSPRSDTHNPPPRPRFALLPRPLGGAGAVRGDIQGKAVPGCDSGPGSSPGLSSYTGPW